MCAERRAPTLDPGAALASASAALKVLPLPGVTLFPGAPLPLRIYEPRYRALVGEALATDRILAVPMLVSEETASQDRAEIHRIAGAVRIEAEQAYPDGRYDILVRGIARVRLGQELETGKPYREFRAEVLDDVYPVGGPASLSGEVEALGQLILDLVGVLPEESGVGQLAHAVAHLKMPGAIADIVAAAAVGEAAARQRILDAIDVAKRLEIVKSEVAAVLLVLSRGRTPDA
ncbi:MAG TPA: LON peptidase substrate-binding domain-containing protein [Anaeromyxobacteraceae bacterium]|nr:LON peptidase substrate-binding domain-containing protein [Anaeromyxobacteraceae bacterium]